MTTKTVLTIATLLLLGFVSSVPALAQQRKALSSDEQNKLLARRLQSGVITGNFGSFGSLIFGVTNIAIHTDDGQIGDTDLHSPFPTFYKPTIRELFDTIAMQTGASWTYDPKTDYWVFAKPAKAKPFSITVADEWTSKDRGVYVSYKPPTYPVGMDIYYYGSYSADKKADEAELWKQIRNSWAIGFASRAKRDVTIAEMSTVTIDGVEAVHFQSPAPRPGVVWRQWAFVKNGHAFMIVSTLPENDDKLPSAVESMVKSFRLTP
jgi:hypothetical protein